MLVGRASLYVKAFIAICQAANDATQSAIGRIDERNKLIPSLC